MQLKYQPEIKISNFYTLIEKITQNERLTYASILIKEDNKVQFSFIKMNRVVRQDT